MNIFITGGTSGIGLQLAKDYLQEGYCVAISARDKTKFETHFNNQEKKPLFYQVDVKNKDGMHEAINDFTQKSGSLDLMIANAGRSLGKKQAWLNFDDARDIIDINLYGVLNTLEPSLNIMKDQGKGHIVVISSTAAFVGLPGSAPYCASKAAILRFSESLSLDYHRYGINISTICPGFIDTPLTQKNQHPMPFLMNVERASLRMRNAIKKKKAFYAFPKRNYFVAKLMNMIPRSLYHKMMKLKALNYSQKS